MTELKRPYLQHYVIEIYGLESIANTDSLRGYTYLFAAQARLHIMGEITHDFKPGGASLIFILSSSHLAMHS